MPTSYRIWTTGHQFHVACRACGLELALPAALVRRLAAARPAPRPHDPATVHYTRAELLQMAFKAEPGSEALAAPSLLHRDWSFLEEALRQTELEDEEG